MAIQHGPSIAPRVPVAREAAAVAVGARFVFRVRELLGHDFSGRVPPFEGQVLTVVGFKPRYVNSVVVRDEDGTESPMRLELVDRALRHEQGPD